MKKHLFLLLLTLGIITSCSNDDDTNNPTINYTISVSASSTNINESDGTISLTITLSEANQGETIPFEFSTSGSATLNQDYSISGEQSIANGSQTATITLTAIDDNSKEGDETIVLTLQESQAGVSVENATVTLTITDDDPCGDTADTYLIDLDPTNCTVDIQNVLGVMSMYQVTTMGGNRVITTNSIPNHNVGQFPNMANPNTITVTNRTYMIDASPTANASVTYLTNGMGIPRYRFGVLSNGILLAPIANEFFINIDTGQDNTEWNENALSSLINLGTDCNNSHVFPSGMYHHHATPSALIAALGIDGSTPVQIGWAADGFPIYYKYANKNGSVAELTSSYRLKTTDRGGDGRSAPSGCPDGEYTQDYEYVPNLGDLDECNGYQDPTLGYIYIITDDYPSIPRCFTATPSDDFEN